MEKGMIEETSLRIEKEQIKALQADREADIEQYIDEIPAVNDDFKKEIALRVEKEIEDFISDPLNIIEAYKKRLKDVEPKIQFYDMVIQSESEFLMREVSKTINFKDMGQNKLFKFLREKEIVNYDNEPYQRFIDGLYFSLKENKWVNPKTGQTNINLTPVVTQKGIDYIIKLLLKSGYVVNDR